MNIHFKDKKIKDKLDNKSIFTTKVGSHMYGLDTNKSDTDYLSIYIKSNYENDSFLWEHHQLQYKDNDIDYNYTDLQTFIRNILSGDATINFEVLYSDELEKSELSWLSKYKKEFVNYNIIKSYLGMAKRDLKIWKSTTKNGQFYNDESNKKLSHFFRGVISAGMLLNNNFSLDFKGSRTFNDSDNDFDILYTSKAGAMGDVSGMVMRYENYMIELREELNEKLNDRTINKYASVNVLKELDKDLRRFTKQIRDRNFLELTVEENSSIDLGNALYEALENGVSY